VFNRFLSKSNVDKAKIQFDMSSIELEDYKNKFSNKIQILINNLSTAKAVLDASKSALISQEQIFKISKKKYNDGLMTSFEFLENKSKYVRAQSEFIKSKYELLFQIKVLNIYSENGVNQ
jgi:outer membrane protein